MPTTQVFAVAESTLQRIKNCNHLPVEVSETFPFKPKFFRKRVRKVIMNGVK
jgi:hypothetical protein